MRSSRSRSACYSIRRVEIKLAGHGVSCHGHGVELCISRFLTFLMLYTNVWYCIGVMHWNNALLRGAIDGCSSNSSINTINNLKSFITCHACT